MGSEEIEVPAVLGVVLAARDVSIAREFLLAMNDLVARSPGVRWVYRKVSAGKLWIMEGEPPEEATQ